MSTAEKKQHLTQALGLWSAVAIVAGTMIGAGIFIVPADIARTVNSPVLFIAGWLITGFMTVVGALAYGELAAMMPQTGGQYVFLRESLGPIWGFLYGWTLFLVIQTGTIAAVAVGFGKFLGVWAPSISAHNWIAHLAHLGGFEVGLHTQNLVAILLIVFLTGVNILGIKTGALIQNVFTFAKVLALVGLIIVGFTIGRDPAAVASNFGEFWRHASWSTIYPVAGSTSGTFEMIGILAVLSVIQVGSLFSADGWNNVTFLATEVKKPQRNLPLALVLGGGGVILLYVLANLAYLSALPLDQIKTAAEDRVGTAVLEHAFVGSGAKWMAAAIMVSTFGCANGMILAGARVYYAMSEDGLFFKSVGRIHSRFKTPAVSLILQGIWASILCVSGTYGQLLDYIIFAALLFYILTIVGLFVLRRSRPDASRPYRAIGYPYLPAIYILMAIFIDAILLRYKPQYTWPGLLIVCTGVPVYWIWTSMSRRKMIAPVA